MCNGTISLFMMHQNVHHAHYLRLVEIGSLSEWALHLEECPFSRTLKGFLRNTRAYFVILLLIVRVFDKICIISMIVLIWQTYYL